MNRELKAQIVFHYGSQVLAARAFGMSTSRLSLLVQEHALPNAHEEELFAQRLGYKFKKRPRAKVSTAQDIAENQPEN